VTAAIRNRGRRHRFAAVALLGAGLVAVTRFVIEKDKADFELSGVSDHQKAGWAKVVFMGQIHSDEQASVKLVNLKTGEVVFAYAVNKKNSMHGRQTAAEACAKHMKELTGE
jgi:hypothetical protein